MRYKELFENDFLSPSDEWLKKYTTENLDKWPSTEIINELLHDYPVTKNTIIYRGLNFSDKKSFDDFMNTLKENNYVLETSSISSWSPNKTEAEQFAKTKPTYFFNMELAKLNDIARDEGEEIIGYRGIILETICKPNSGIDVTKSKFSKESEIILIPGKYKVKVTEIKKFKDQIFDGDTNPDKIISKITKDDIKNNTDLYKFLNWILKKIDPTNLSNKSKRKIFDLFNGDKDYGYDIFDDKYSFDDYSVVNFYYRSKIFDLADKGFLLNSDIKNLKNRGIKVLKDFMEIAIKNPDAKINSKGQLNNLVKYCNYEEEWTEFLKMYGKQYNDLEKTVKNINKITDKTQKNKEIEKYKDDLVKILNNIANL